MKTLLMGIALLLVAATPGLAWDTFWVVTTDYSTFGRIRAVDRYAPWSVSADLATIPGDAVARHHNGLIHVVGRGGSNLLQVYDPAAGFALVKEFSLGADRNPQDIAFDSAGEAYISCYDKALLLRVNTVTGAILGTYSTAAYADADGRPETAWLTAVGDRLFITAQKLDRNNWYAPTGPGQLLVFDMTSETFAPPVNLTGANPYTQIEQVRLPGGAVQLRVGCAGFYGLADGGIEAVDPVLGQSLGYVATEAVLGGDVTAFASTGETLHVLVSNTSFVTSLRRFVPATGQVSVLATGNGYVHADVAFDGGFQLFVADRTAGASGLRVYDVSSGAQMTGGVLPTGLPPFMIVLPTAVDPAPVPPAPGFGSLSLGDPFPNPCNPRAEVTLTGEADQLVNLSVFDLRGHRVAVAQVRLAADGHGVWTFTGQDARGRSLPAGVYRLAAQSGTGFAARSVTLVK